MPTNVTIEYQLAEKEYNEAATIEQKIRAIEKMLATAPSHKGAENLRANLKGRLSKLKSQAERERKQKSGAYQISVKKEGAAQIAVIGYTNSGKSTFLKKMTNAKPIISEYPFTTKIPEIGIIDYKGIKIQIVEIPAIFDNFIRSDKGPLFLGIIRQADLVVILLRNNPNEEFNDILKELGKANIFFSKPKKSNDYYTYLKAFVIINSKSRFSEEDFDSANINDANLIEKIWRKLDLIYVNTKTPGKKPDYPPVALKKDSNVQDLATHIHKDFLKKFRYAKVWGVSSKFAKGQVVGLSHILKEGDTVEFHLK